MSDKETWTYHNNPSGKKRSFQMDKNSSEHQAKSRLISIDSNARLHSGFNPHTRTAELHKLDVRKEGLKEDAPLNSTGTAIARNCR